MSSRGAEGIYHSDGRNIHISSLKNMLNVSNVSLCTFKKVIRHNFMM